MHEVGPGAVADVDLVAAVTERDRNRRRDDQGIDALAAALQQRTEAAGGEMEDQIVDRSARGVGDALGLREIESDDTDPATGPTGRFSDVGRDPGVGETIGRSA
ncbi:hypothetical protein GCM10009539_05260 [Cryptosporangium japonicum]|uniref:Uncharacterized protein n=1 Tax=Cryptosporangium japonicum TaxID=80872 RepID=A0ABN0TJ69_9ACTN